MGPSFFLTNWCSLAAFELFVYFCSFSFLWELNAVHNEFCCNDLKASDRKIHKLNVSSLELPGFDMNLL